ncbi:hypothetical protein JCM5350_007680 [Sporobolomyces pararoseus]
MSSPSPHSHSSGFSDRQAHSLLAQGFAGVPNHDNFLYMFNKGMGELLTNWFHGCVSLPRNYIANDFTYMGHQVEGTAHLQKVVRKFRAPSIPVPASWAVPYGREGTESQWIYKVPPSFYTTIAGPIALRFETLHQPLPQHRSLEPPSRTFYCSHSFLNNLNTEEGRESMSFRQQDGVANCRRNGRNSIKFEITHTYNVRTGRTLETFTNYFEIDFVFIPYVPVSRTTFDGKADVMDTRV